MFGRRVKDYDYDKPWWKQRSWILSVSFVVAAVLMAVVAWLTGGDGKQPAANSGPPRASSLGPDGRPVGCRTDDSDTAVPKSAPPDVQWRDVEGTSVPTSPSAGPKLVDGVLSCFAHTPMGAVVAAHVIPAQLIGERWRAVIDQQMVPGLSRDIFQSQRESVADTVATAARANVPLYSGFRVASYTPDTAVVALLVKNTMGGLSTTSMTLRWSDGDWRVQPGSTGKLRTDVQSVRSTEIFVKWSK